LSNTSASEATEENIFMALDSQNSHLIFTHIESEFLSVKNLQTLIGELQHPLGDAPCF